MRQCGNQAWDGTEIYHILKWPYSISANIVADMLYDPFRIYYMVRLGYTIFPAYWEGGRFAGMTDTKKPIRRHIFGHSVMCFINGK